MLGLIVFVPMSVEEVAVDEEYGTRNKTKKQKKQKKMVCMLFVVVKFKSPRVK